MPNITSTTSTDSFAAGWERLRHGGLLLDPPRLRQIGQNVPAPPSPYIERELRRRAGLLLSGGETSADFVAFVLEHVCGFDHRTGSWQRGSHVGTEWTRRGVAGEAIRPRMLWQGANAARLPMFVDDQARVGIGRGRRAASQVLQWLRAGDERLALLTNGRQWRLIFAGLDFDAWCEWDVDLWFEEGQLSPQITALQTLLQPQLWTPAEAKSNPLLLQAILDSRKGQAELSAELGERVRAVVEILVDAHGDVLKVQCADVDPRDIYRAAVRVVMRMVVVMFAESRDLLPRDNALYHATYGLGGLLEELEKIAARGGNRLGRSWNAWPRVLALFRLVREGSHHPALPVTRYGGELFARGERDSSDGLSRALAVFENACFEGERMSDREVHRMLERITRTRVKVRMGRGSTWMPTPVDFSDLSSEYIGILYEGLLDFELKTAPANDPVIFLAVGNQPALPLSRLEGMEDAAIANLLEKMKDTSKASDDEGDADVEDVPEDESPDEKIDAELSDDMEEPAPEDDAVEEPAAHDALHATRTRAEEWARRAVAVGKLVTKPRGKITAEKQREYEAAVSRKARQLVTRVVLPGEWYLVRWGGTRKGSGTFYTRPGLAVPTVQRTLRPLAYDAPAGADGEPDRMAPHARWTPRTPEEILALKVCDPACGSGTFPVAALRFLTDAVYAALHHHGRIARENDRAVVRLLEGTSPAGPVPEERLGHELLPDSPDSDLFEPRLKAVLRRHVVERCIYGVDLDPLAVELCRLALWIETMDRTLPFSFLDHKIKVGNSLIGAWFDTFQHYPVMAWKNREGGDTKHGNGVHFAKDARGKAIRAFKERLPRDLQRFLGGLTLELFDSAADFNAGAVHDRALTTLRRMHDLPVHDAATRARVYRDELVGTIEFQELKDAMDRWCACWFWPADQLDIAPLPTVFAHPSSETAIAARQIATAKRFFHWELEFPDVFRDEASGFDAVLGNPPWDIAKPSSKEFFSNVDPLFRAYGKQEAVTWQTQYFGHKVIERDWLDYNGDFRAQSNYVGYAAAPFGDPTAADNSNGRFSIARGRANNEYHATWRTLRSRSSGFADPGHAFQHQGSADLNLYKLFLEQSYALLRDGGRLGFVVPSGLYSDHGTTALRALFLNRCSWEWLFGFENRERIFGIHRSYKFNPVVIQKGGVTRAIETAFMRRRLEDWASTQNTLLLSRQLISRLSPQSSCILEVTDEKDIEVVDVVFGSSNRFVAVGDGEPRLRYVNDEFHITKDSHLFPPIQNWLAKGYEPTSVGVWVQGQNRAMPLYEGRMIDQFDPSAKGWVRGKGRSAEWRDIPWENKKFEPQYLIDAKDASSSRYPRLQRPCVVFKKVTSGTNTRSLHTTLSARIPSSDSAPVIYFVEPSLVRSLALVARLNSFVCDYVFRLRMSGVTITWQYLSETPIPSFDDESDGLVAFHTARLCMAHYHFAPEWMALISRQNRTFALEATWALTPLKRLEVQCSLDAVVAGMYGLAYSEFQWIMRQCDLALEKINAPHVRSSLYPKGFWRVDRDKVPHLRRTILAQVAFQDFLSLLSECNGDMRRTIKEYLTQHDGDGWRVPDSICLDDYNCGDGEHRHQVVPVRAMFGNREFAWQQAHSPAVSWAGVSEAARWLSNMTSEENTPVSMIDSKTLDRGNEA